jgi:hypothetical protein
MKSFYLFLFVCAISSVCCVLSTTTRITVGAGLIAIISITAATGFFVIEELKPKEQKKEDGQTA